MQYSARVSAIRSVNTSDYNFNTLCRRGVLSSNSTKEITHLVCASVCPLTLKFARKKGHRETPERRNRQRETIIFTLDL